MTTDKNYLSGIVEGLQLQISDFKRSLAQIDSKLDRQLLAASQDRLVIEERLGKFQTELVALNANIVSINKDLFDHEDGLNWRAVRWRVQVLWRSSMSIIAVVVSVAVTAAITFLLS